jgi:hypothetical protein
VEAGANETDVDLQPQPSPWLGTLILGALGLFVAAVRGFLGRKTTGGSPGCLAISLEIVSVALCLLAGASPVGNEHWSFGHGPMLDSVVAWANLLFFLSAPWLLLRYARRNDPPAEPVDGGPVLATLASLVAIGITGGGALLVRILVFRHDRWPYQGLPILVSFVIFGLATFASERRPHSRAVRVFQIISGGVIALHGLAGVLYAAYLLGYAVLVPMDGDIGSGSGFGLFLLIAGAVVIWLPTRLAAAEWNAKARRLTWSLVRVAILVVPFYVLLAAVIAWIATRVE